MADKFETDKPHQIKKTRSPGYPGLSLGEACDRLEPIWKNAGRHQVPLSTLASVWEMSPTSSSVLVTAAALKHYSLVEEADSDSGQRLFKLSQLALQILNHPRDSEQRLESLRRAAMEPKIYREMWEKYEGDLPSDDVLRPYLLIERAFNKESVDRFLAKFRESVEYAKLATEVSAQRPKDNSQSQNNYDHYTAGSEAAGATSRHTNGERLTTIADLTATASVCKSLPIPLEDGRTVIVPYPMTEEDFNLFLSTLELWKKRIVRPAPPSMDHLPE